MKPQTQLGQFAETRRKRSRRERVIPILPNLLTTGNLFFGLLSIMTSIQIAAVKNSADVSPEWLYEKFWWAGAFIVVAALLDFLDGKVARIFKSESSFGLSYDSLADLVSFGVAPGVLIYIWVLMGSGKLGLMAVLFYTVCAALRLARFNVQSKTIERFSFSGLPSPMGAGVMVSPILLFSEFRILPDQSLIWFYLFAAPFAGLLMVSDVPYWKYPRLSLSGPFNALVVAAIIIAAVVTNPEIMLVSMVYLYCLTGLVLYAFRQLNKKPRAIGDSEGKELPGKNF